MKRNTIVALAIAAVLALWLIVGSCARGPASIAESAAQQEEAPLPKVRFRISQAEMRTEEVVLRGKTEPARIATLRAEAPGRVAAIEQPRGAFDGVLNERFTEIGEYVGAGDPLFEFLELSPLIVSAEATEIEVQKLRMGQKARAKAALESR